MLASAWDIGDLNVIVSGEWAHYLRPCDVIMLLKGSSKLTELSLTPSVALALPSHSSRMVPSTGHLKYVRPKKSVYQLRCAIYFLRALTVLGKANAQLSVSVATHRIEMTTHSHEAGVVFPASDFDNLGLERATLRHYQLMSCLSWIMLWLLRLILRLFTLGSQTKLAEIVTSPDIKLCVVDHRRGTLFLLFSLF